MNYQEFLRSMESPVAGAILEKWPKGHIAQLWAENPKLYANAAGRYDDFHTHFGGHTGIDILGAQGTPIRAAHDGNVIATQGERTKQGGLEVWIESAVYDDNGTLAKCSTSYSHLDSYIVQVGQYVTKGQVVGYMGNTGFVISGGTKYWGNAPAGKGVHLHYGLHEYVFKNGYWQPRYVNVLRNSTDPLPYISETPEMPEGNLSGIAVMLGHMKQYLSRSS